MNRFATTLSVASASLCLLLASACGGASSAPSDDDDGLPPPVDGHAYLSIVGDASVFAEGGAHQTLTVKYHDEHDAPLAGRVEFVIQGEASGGALSTTSGVTSAEGLVRIDVVAGSEAVFHVRATAAYAEPVEWTIAVAPEVVPPPPLDVTGTYELSSEFDLASGLPGTVGTVVNGLLDMTDDPNDPATWLIDEALEHISSSVIKNAVNAFRPALDGFVNDALLAAAPALVGKLVAVAHDLGQVARQFGTISTLTIVADADGLIATHQIDGFVFEIDGQRYEYSLAEIELGQSRAEGVPVLKVSETRVDVGEHTLPISYGRLLLFALDHVVVPAIDPFASSFAELLANLVDCAAVGAAMSDYIGIGSAGTYTAACQGGLGAVASLVESQLLGIDGQGAALVIHGEARPQDTTSDYRTDKLTGGLWEGKMTFGSSAASVLAKPAQKFVGTRMLGTP